MTFYNEILLKFGFSPEETVGSKITVIDLRGVLVEGHKGILKYSPEETVIRLKQKYLRIVGEGLSVLSVDKDEIYIKGRICSCEATDER